MKVNFVKISPSQNMTILVKDHFKRNMHKEVAEKLMDYSNVYAEQVGFIEEPTNKQAVARLQMMGNEFCGNATLSLASYLIWSKNLPIGSEETILLEVSGADHLLDCKVIIASEDSFKSKVKMPSPEKFDAVTIDIAGTVYEFPRVCMPGINHYLVDLNTINDKVLFADEAVGKIKAIDSGDAFGLMFWNKENNYIYPLVYVCNTESLVWERGCGSGSAAVGAYLSHIEKSYDNRPISQPGGVITVYTNDTNDVWIEGVVKIAAEGIAFI